MGPSRGTQGPWEDQEVDAENSWTGVQVRWVSGGLCDGRTDIQTAAPAQDRGGSCDDPAGLTPRGSKGFPSDILEPSSGVAEPQF